MMFCFICHRTHDKKLNKLHAILMILTEVHALYDDYFRLRSLQTVRARVRVRGWRFVYRSIRVLSETRISYW